MAGGVVNEVFGWLTGVDHEAILYIVLALAMFSAVCYVSYSELHRLGTSSSQLAGHNDFTALCARLHDEPQDTVACSSDGQTVEELVSEGLALCDSGETSVLDLGGVERDAVLGELESLLDEGCEFTDSSSLLAEYFLCVGCSDDCSLVRFILFLFLRSGRILISVTVGVTRTSTPE